jgi:hypothetical protein
MQSAAKLSITDMLPLIMTVFTGLDAFQTSSYEGEIINEICRPEIVDPDFFGKSLFYRRGRIIIKTLLIEFRIDSLQIPLCARICRRLLGKNGVLHVFFGFIPCNL